MLKSTPFALALGASLALSIAAVVSATEPCCVVHADYNYPSEPTNPCSAGTILFCETGSSGATEGEMGKIREGYRLANCYSFSPTSTEVCHCDCDEEPPFGPGSIRGPQTGDVCCWIAPWATLNSSTQLEFLVENCGGDFCIE